MLIKVDRLPYVYIVSVIIIIMGSRANCRTIHVMSNSRGNLTQIIKPKNKTMNYNIEIEIVTSCKVIEVVEADTEMELAAVIKLRLNECLDMTPTYATIAARNAYLIGWTPVTAVTDLPVGY